MNPALKRLLEDLLNSALPAWLIRRYARHRTLILGYHNVVLGAGSPRGDRSLHLAVDVFAQQLDLLAETCEVVPLTKIIEPNLTRRPRLAITFDDAYRGAVTIGTAELRKRGLPATIFVAPAFVGGQAFWWDELTPPGAESPVIDRSMALGALQGKDQAVREWARQRSLGPFPAGEDQQVATEDELRVATHTGLVTLGSHSWSHPNLATLPEPELAEELTRPLDWLRSRFEAVVPWLSYPYGCSSPLVEHVARAKGYVAGLRIEGGWVRHPERRPYEIPRLNVPAGISGPGFSLRTAAFVTAR